MIVEFERWSQMAPDQRRYVAAPLAGFILSRPMKKTGSAPAIVARIAYLRKRLKEAGEIPLAFEGSSAAWIGRYPDTGRFVLHPPEGMEWNEALHQTLEEVYFWQKMSVQG